MIVDTPALDPLSAGTLRWIGQNARFLDPTTDEYQLPTTPRVKGLLQLALLRHYWARLRPEDEELGEITAFIVRVWQWPGFLRQIACERSSARQYGLMFGALAPAGMPDGPHSAILAKLAAAGYLTSHRKTPYARLETRYLADKAGLGHEIESYRELYESSILASRTAPLPISDSDACAITHAVLYLSDFGFRDPGLTPDERQRALRLICPLTDYHASRDEWDHIAKFVLAQLCLGADPVRTPSGAAGLQRLARAQTASGSIPAASAARRAGESATEIELFRQAYQATVAAALTALILSSASLVSAPPSR